MYIKHMHIAYSFGDKELNTKVGFLLLGWVAWCLYVRTYISTYMCVHECICTSTWKVAEVFSPNLEGCRDGSAKTTETT